MEDMAKTSEETPRPGWLAACLAASSAVLVYRLSGAALDILFSMLRGSSLRPVQLLCDWQGPVELVLKLLLAMLGATLLHRIMSKRSAKAQFLALAAFVVLAAFPLRLSIAYDLVEAPAGPPVAPQDVAPVSLKFKLLEAENISPDVVIDERNVQEAGVTRGLRGGEYAVRLVLDAEGRKRIADLTTREVGKSLAMFVDGELKCSPRIAAPILSGEILIPARFSQEEAARIAAGLNANE